MAVISLYISQLSVRPSVRHCVRNSLSCCSRWTYRHDFWHESVFRLWHADFCKIGVIGQRSKSKIHKPRPFLGLFWSQGPYVGLFRTREGQMGYYWQHANLFWQLAKSQRTTGGLLQTGFQVLASCQFGWQGAKFEKSPRPKHRTILRCEVCASIYISYISVSKSTPLAVTGPHGQLASHILHTGCIGPGVICFTRELYGGVPLHIV